MLDFNREENCYGCGACAYICPKHAITMKPNFEGFFMPEIDGEKCIQCGLCEQKCTYLHAYPAENTLEEAVCKAAYRVNEDVRMKSASGGIATALSESVLQDGGVVVGCGWTDDLRAKHMAISCVKEIDRLQSSKYVQSDMSDAYQAIKEGLQNSNNVLFVGTPCQIGAVRNIFGNPSNLYLVGLICGGVPSPLVWERFKAESENKYKSEMIHANFRSKGRYGWSTPVALYEFANGRKSEKLSYHLDDYVLQYLYGVFKRNSCFQCGYKGNTVNADIMLGDYWGSPTFRDKSNNKGVSAILCLTKKGEKCLDYLSGSCAIIDTTLAEIMQKNQMLVHSVGRTGNRKEFFDALNKHGYRKAARKYGGKTNPIKYFCMRILDKTGLFELVKRKVKD